jgi:hypothetical protein
MMRIALMWLIGTALIGLGTPQQTEQSKRSTEPPTLVERFLTSSEPPPASYRAVRVLRAEARGGRMKASLKAVTVSDPDHGFRFEIIEESGSGVIRSKVLRAALKAEADAWKERAAQPAALTERNYEFLSGEPADDGLVRVRIRPRRKASMLIEGSIFLTEADADLVRIEGTLVKRPSFWTRRVEIVRKYARIAGARVPVAMSSVADVLLAGRSTFSMEYSYESINGQSIPPSAPLPSHAGEGVGAVRR